MKKLFLAIILTLLIAPMAYGADVIITITIPDAFVSRLQAAVSNLNCTVVDEAGEIIDTLGPKACLERKIKNELKEFVNECEERQGKQVAQDAYNSAYQQWVDIHDPFEVN